LDDDSERGKNDREEAWTKRYTAGVALLDLNDPRRVLGISREPLLAPEAPYETTGGYRNNVVFPCGWVPEDESEMKIYYGDADTVQCLATAHIDDFIPLCEPLADKLS
jgi:beta-1,4-mannooligosaccharide/beta-1,4-mannosyl-N-acetylglucosamine phosphorylase